MTERFTVLFVCVGNVCRSPLAEAVLRARLDERLGDLSDAVTVESAGIKALVGSPVDPMVVSELERLGLPTPSGTARQLTSDMVKRADLVLTASKDLRSDVLEKTPSALRRTFTIREFAALVNGAKSASPKALVAEAVRRRSAANVRDYDIADPRGRGSRAHRKAADLIAVSVSASIGHALAAAVKSESDNAEIDDPPPAIPRSSGPTSSNPNRPRAVEDSA